MASLAKTKTQKLLAPQTFAIHLSRVPKVENAPGLILLRIDPSRDSEPPTTIGYLTDAALRGRLGHFDLHSANELAAIRHSLSTDAGETTIYEHWSGLETCVQFWCAFTGSQIRPMSWTCETCGKTGRDSIGGSVGETIPRLCACGQATRVTIPKTISG